MKTYKELFEHGSFWSKVRKTESCWEWIGAKNSRGYGLLCGGGGKRDKRNVFAHRVSFEGSTGTALSRSDHVCHHCDNPCCVNPEHLYLGDAAQNSRDRVTRIRARGATGERNPNCKVCPEVVASIRSMADNGIPMTCVARIYGITDANAGYIAARKTWRHVP